jgi:hypothetical protein
VSDNPRDLIPMMVDVQYATTTDHLWTLTLDSLTMADVLTSLGLAVKSGYAAAAPVLEAVRIGLKSKGMDD